MCLFDSVPSAGIVFDDFVTRSLVLVQFISLFFFGFCTLFGDFLLILWTLHLVFLSYALYILGFGIAGLFLFCRFLSEQWSHNILIVIIIIPLSILDRRAEYCERKIKMFSSFVQGLYSIVWFNLFMQIIKSRF